MVSRIGVFICKMKYITLVFTFFLIFGCSIAQESAVRPNDSGFFKISPIPWDEIKTNVSTEHFKFVKSLDELKNAISNSEKFIRIDNEIIISENLTIPEGFNIDLTEKSKFTIIPPNVLTFNAFPVNWNPNTQVFFGSGHGGSTLPREVEGTFSDQWRYAEWFGAKGNDISFDNSDAIQSAVSASIWSKPAANGKQIISQSKTQLLGTTYYIQKEIDLRECNFTLRGAETRGATKIAAPHNFSFNGKKFFDETYTNASDGFEALIVFGSLFPPAIPGRPLGPFGNRFEFIFLDASYASADATSKSKRTACVYSPDMIQEGTTFRNCLFQGASAYLMCFGSFDESSSNYSDVNMLVIEECELMGTQSYNGKNSAISIKIARGRFIDIRNCTIIGRNVVTAEPCQPSILSKASVLKISNCHLESGDPVVKINPVPRLRSSLDVGPGLVMENCDSIQNMGTMVEINSPNARVNLTNLSATYNCADPTRTPWRTNTPCFVHDVDRNVFSAGVGTNGGFRALLRYDRYREAGTHPLVNNSLYNANGTAYKVGYLIDTPHPELK